MQLRDPKATSGFYVVAGWFPVLACINAIKLTIQLKSNVMSRIVEENDGAEDEGEFVLFHGIVYLGAATIEDPRDEDRVRISMSELGGQVTGKRLVSLIEAWSFRIQRSQSWKVSEFVSL